MDTIKSIKYGKAMRTARVYAHLSQKDMAKILGCSPITLHRYETGQRMPPADVYDKALRYGDKEKK